MDNNREQRRRLIKAKEDLQEGIIGKLKKTKIEMKKISKNQYPHQN